MNGRRNTHRHPGSSNTQRNSSSSTIDPTSNHLLAALPISERSRWCALVEPVQLRLGQVLYEPGRALSHAYFPGSAVASVLYVTAEGKSAEIAVVGNEGVVGISLFMGGDTTPNWAVVQNAGVAFRLPAGVMKAEFERCLSVHHLLLRYTQALITQMAQTVACNRHHTVDQQLCRWLLSCLDRVDGQELATTQELIAHMLGVRREGVTEAAVKLQRAGLITYARGHLKVLDRPGLEHRSCECYRVVKAEYERLLPRCTAL